MHIPLGLSAALRLFDPNVEYQIARIGEVLDNCIVASGLDKLVISSTVLVLLLRVLRFARLRHPGHPSKDARPAQPSAVGSLVRSRRAGHARTFAAMPTPSMGDKR